MRRRRRLIRCVFLLAMFGSSYAIADRVTDNGATATEIVRAVSNSELEEILSGVDFVPPKQDLDDLLGDAALDELLAIARDPGKPAGVRIRAYRALSHYPGARTEYELQRAIQEHSANDLIALSSTGVDTILLRASMDSLAVIAKADALVDIADKLNHKSRDVRAAAARALAVCGSSDAEKPLRDRLEVEEVPQVRYAIQDALRVLTGDSSN